MQICCTCVVELVEWLQLLSIEFSNSFCYERFQNVIVANIFQLNRKMTERNSPNEILLFSHQFSFIFLSFERDFQLLYGTVSIIPLETLSESLLMTARNCHNFDCFLEVCLCVFLVVKSKRRKKNIFCFFHSKH